MKTKLNPNIAILIIVILIIGFVYFIISSKQDNISQINDTTDLISQENIYINTDSGYSINIGSKYSEETSVDGEKPFTFQNTKIVTDTFSLVITVTDPGMEGIIRHSYDIDSEDPVDLNSISGSKIIAKTAKNGETEYVYILNNDDNLYLIKSSSPKLESIINTFTVL